MWPVDDPNGNSYVNVEDGDSFFACGSISSSFFEFDPEKEAFSELASLPKPRYRHSSAIANDKVWIVGGRDLEDNLISDVDVSKLASYCTVLFI